MLLGAGAVAKKTYVDDVFSTYLIKGNATARSINTGIDMTDGGLVWSKSRSWAVKNAFIDSERGGNAILQSPSTSGEVSASSQGITAFNNNGYSIGTYNLFNGNNDTFVHWSFKKQKKFFDIVTYSGTNSARTQAHNLGSVPGLIIVKSKTGLSENWQVYHKSLGATKYLQLNDNGSVGTNSNRWNDTEPTSSVFSLGSGTETNGQDGTYVAYLFAGGESTAATARSVDLDGSDDYFQTSIGSDYTFGTGDFTIEGWFKFDSTSNSGLLMQASSGTGLGTSYSLAVLLDNSFLKFKAAGSEYVTKFKCSVNQWVHIALVRSSSNTSFYVNGVLQNKVSDTTDYSGTDLIIGGYWSESYVMDGSISNFRVVKGTAVYTSSFIPPTEPLTSITNTVLLFCQNTTTTGTTTGTVGQNSPPTVSTNSPFDDPAAFTFGESGSESLIKCGSYVGNGNADGPEIFLGWEPQWVMIKNTGSAESWAIYDSMRGIISGGNDPGLYADANYSEYSANIIDLTSTGFKLVSSAGDVNESNKNFIYVCIRRPDGYCGKPPELGTSVFAMDTGNGSTIVPAFDSGFPVDFGLTKNPDSSGDWYTVARLLGGNHLVNSGSNAISNSNWTKWDSNVGEGISWSSSYQSWMFKRHAGFDVVTYTGNDVARTISHSMNAVPEMMWVKNRSQSMDWMVYHKGLNGGTNPEQYYAVLNSAAAEVDLNMVWNDTAPTSSAITLGTHSHVNGNADNFIAMLFASVDGISKVGYYQGSSSDIDLDLGFVCRFIIIKRRDSAGDPWFVFDSVRGINGSNANDPYLALNSNTANNGAGFGTHNFIEPITNGVKLKTGRSGTNYDSSEDYIYYAHA